MHIYIQLTEEGWQRSFPAIWGWHWYRSYLRQKATEATDSTLGLLLRLWAPFLTLCTTGAAGTGYVFSPCLDPLHIIYQRELPCVCSYPETLVSVLVPEDWGDLCTCCQLTATHSMLFACVHQVMLNSLQSTFVRMWLIWHEQSLV